MDVKQTFDMIFLFVENSTRPCPVGKYVDWFDWLISYCARQRLVGVICNMILVYHVPIYLKYLHTSNCSERYTVYTDYCHFIYCTGWACCLFQASYLDIKCVRVIWKTGILDIWKIISIPDLLLLKWGDCKLHHSQEKICNLTQRRAAFDSVDMDALFKLLEIIGIPLKLIWLFRGLYTETISCVRCESELSQWFEVKTGVRQGCILSPDAFNVTMDRIIGRTVSGTHVDSSIGEAAEAACSDFDFADDVALLAEAHDTLTSAVILRGGFRAGSQYQLVNPLTNEIFGKC